MDRRDHRIHKELKDELSRILATDEGSVISRRNAINRVREAITRRPGPQKASMLEEYEAGNMSRRQFLKLLGVSVGGAAAAASGTAAFLHAAETPTGYATVRGINFNNVVNAVDDLGMDPNGNEAIDGILEDNMQDNTLIRFPPGTYRYEAHIQAPELQNFGMIGTGSSHKDVRFFEDGNRMELSQYSYKDDGNGLKFLSFGLGGTSRRHRNENVLLENFTIDQRNPWDGGGNTGMDIEVWDNFQIRNIEFAGFNPAKSFSTNEEGDGRELTIRVHNPNGACIIDGFTSIGGSEMYPHGSYAGPGNSSRIGVAGEHSGTVYIRNSHIENSGTHGMYATNHDNGAIRVENCLWKNNNLTQLRLGGNGSWVKDSVVVIDTDNAPKLEPGAPMSEIRDAIRSAGDYPPNYDGRDDLQARIDGDGDRSAKPNDGDVVFNNTPGLLWQSYAGANDGLTENCDIICRSYADKWGQIGWLFAVYGDHGAMTLRNTRIHNETTVRRIVRFNQPGGFGFGPTPSEPHRIVMDNVHIVDQPPSSGNHAGSLNEVVWLEGRDDSEIRNCCIQSDREVGILLDGSSNVTIADTSISNDTPIDGNSANRQNVQTGSASCQMPQKDESDWDSSAATGPTPGYGGSGGSSGSSGGGYAGGGSSGSGTVNCDPYFE